jgi:capsid protein
VIVDAGREAQQNRADVEMGLKTLSDHFAELGADFGEEIERRVSSLRRRHSIWCNAMIHSE